VIRVPFVDLSRQHAPLERELFAALGAVVESSQFILGPAVERFERSFAHYLGVGHCVGVNSGTSALHLALLACGIGPGDEVITTPLSWVSTSWAVSYVGARPVFVDVDPRTLAVDPDEVERAITPHTKAILPVHLYGQAADLPRLSELAERHDLWLIEDAAQAHGAVCQGRRVGAWGDLGCFSFYPGKNLGAWGEGGAVVTDDAQLAERIRSLRDHAQRSRHEHTAVGYNYRLEGIQGAVLEVKLRWLDAWNRQRAAAAGDYRRRLAGIDGLVLPEAADAAAHVWHLFVIQVASTARDEVRRRLEVAGIGTAIHYPRPIPYQPAYRELGYRPGAFPNAERAAAGCLSLPLFPGIRPEEIEEVCAALCEALEALGPLESERAIPFTRPATRPSATRRKLRRAS
jgi:dTDP-4-amino-4,6-dideoxygalactose transaminase